MSDKIAIIADNGPSDASAEYLADAVEGSGREAPVLDAGTSLAAALKDAEPDAALICATGTAAQSARIALDTMGIPYVGPAARTCRGASDMVNLFSILGNARKFGELCAHVPYMAYLDKGCLEKPGVEILLEELEQRLPDGYPVTVGTPYGHADGRSAARDRGQLLEAIGTLDTEEGLCIWESPEGTRATVSMFGEPGDIEVLPPAEHARDGLHIPVRLESLSHVAPDAQAIRSEMERAALDVYLACGCRDYASVEILWDGARACVLDVDLAPQLGPDSIFAKQCAAAGISADELVDELVYLALDRR